MTLIVTLFKFLILIVIFGIIFSLVPRYSYLLVKRLLSYYDYKREPLKRRTYETTRVYLILGIALGFVFMFLFSIGDFNIDPSLLGGESSQNIFLLSFAISFSLVMILRISTLLSKSELICKFLPETQRQKISLSSQNYDYAGLKNETSSFLFSIFLAASLTSMVYFSYKLLFFPQSLFVNLSLSLNYKTFLFYILFLVVFVLVLCLITFLGELTLTKVGVRPRCKDFAND